MVRLFPCIVRTQIQAAVGDLVTITDTRTTWTELVVTVSPDIFETESGLRFNRMTGVETTPMSAFFYRRIVTGKK